MTFIHSSVTRYLGSPACVWVTGLVLGTSLAAAPTNGINPSPVGGDSVRTGEAKSEDVEPYKPLLDQSIRIDESPESAEDLLEDAATLKEAVVRSGPVDRAHQKWIDSMNRLDERYGLRLSLDYNALVQYASESLGDDLGSAGEIRGTLRWRPWGRDGMNPANIVFQGWHRHGYSDIAPSALGTSIGSLWPTTRGFNDRGWAVNSFYYEQYVADDRVAFRGGWTRVDSMLDAHAMRAQRTFFLNSGVTDNPAVPFPSSALAGIVMVRPTETIKLKAALSDADSRQLRESGDSDRFFKDYFAAGQIEWRPRLLDQGESLLQAMYWHRSTSAEPSRPDGDGVSVLAQQQWERNRTAFVRYSYSSSAVSTARHMVATGGGLAPFPDGRPDLVGLSLAWGQPSVSTARDQYTVEAFYRLQLTPEMQLTPDIQLIIDPSFNPTEDLIVVFGMRARLVF